MHIKPWKVTNTKIIHQTPWISVIEDECEADGKQLTYTYVHRRDEGPNIIAEEADGRLWMVQQYRHPIQRIVWQFPAEGKMPEESWKAAAERGLAEEVGKKPGKLTNLGIFHPDPGGLKQTAHLFLATELTDIQVEKFHQTSEEVEELNKKAFTLTEIDQLIENGEICDGWTLGALYLYNRYKNR